MIDKPKRLVYFPLEGYEERYTQQLSAPKTGWFESKLLMYKVPYIRIEGDTPTKKNSIKTGSVLDAFTRSRWCLQQIQNYLNLLEEGTLDENDALYFEDFFHPGLETIPYIRNQMSFAQQKKIPKNIYSFCWAQSADMHDFTNRLGKWIRHIERGYGYIYNTVFVASTLLTELLHQAGLTPEYKVRVVGLPFDSEQVRSMMKPVKYENKLDQTVFSSRWAPEKRVHLALNLMNYHHERHPDHRFVFCSSGSLNPKHHEGKAPSWPISDSEYKKLLAQNNVSIHSNLSKKEYYDILVDSKFQINTSLQDWVSYTLLEAACAGCSLIYPVERSFPETFAKFRDVFGTDPMLNITNMQSVSDRIAAGTKIPMFSHGKKACSQFDCIVPTHDFAIDRIIAKMGLLDQHQWDDLLTRMLYYDVSIQKVYANQEY